MATYQVASIIGQRFLMHSGRWLGGELSSRRLYALIRPLSLDLLKNFLVVAAIAIPPLLCSFRFQFWRIFFRVVLACFFPPLPVLPLERRLREDSGGLECESINYGGLFFRYHWAYWKPKCCHCRSGYKRGGVYFKYAFGELDVCGVNGSGVCSFEYSVAIQSGLVRYIIYSICSNLKRWYSS